MFIELGGGVERNINQLPPVLTLTDCKWNLQSFSVQDNVPTNWGTRPGMYWPNLTSLVALPANFLEPSQVNTVYITLIIPHILYSAWGTQRAYQKLNLFSPHNCHVPTYSLKLQVVAGTFLIWIKIVKFCPCLTFLALFLIVSFLPRQCNAC